YELWAGSGLDLDALVEESVSQMPPGQPLAPLLARLAPPRPIIARRHLFHTGTLRYFEVRFVDGESLDKDLWPLLTEGPVQGGDGIILLVVTSSQSLRARLSDSLSEGRLFEGALPDHPIVVALPSFTTNLTELALELSALERIESSTPALQSDAVTRRELAARIAELRQVLEQEVARVYSAENPECEWYAPKGRLSCRSSRELVETLSELF